MGGLPKAKIVSQTKFLTSSVIATGVDYVLYLLLDWLWFDPVTAHTISYPIAVVVNFYLQKRFIFDLKRKAHHAFAISMLFSVIGWGLGVAMFWGLVKLPILCDWPILAKIIVTGVLFFFNFYTKRYAFEGR
ncbi:MAG: GtrA family protein [Saprospiraceae bacterium]|jgi:putative flippase GtrA|nr:GtrA family protein [Saprospiraceae bacterium]